MMMVGRGNKKEKVGENGGVGDGGGGGEMDDGRAFSTHLIEHVTDEIALEGLDGITLQALKVRLEQRANFNVEDFEDIAPAIWNQLKLSKYFRFYLMPKARGDLVPYRWNENRDARGNFCEPLHAPVEIYTYYPVEDKQRCIRGSSEHFYTRKDVTHIVRMSSYVQILQGFGNRLVIVASQYLREFTLFGRNYRKHQNLSIVQYCMMERVARARSLGEVTRGKVSLNCLNIPPKTQFYMRKNLLKSGLVKRQPAAIKYAGSKCPSIITVFHLPRFYKRIESVGCLNTRVIFSWLNNSATKSIPIERVISKYGKHTLRTIMEQFPTLIEKAWEDASPPPPEEDNAADPPLKTKYKPSKPKAVRVLQLRVTDTSVQNHLICKVFDDQSQNSKGAGEDDNTTATGSGDQGPQQEDGEQEINVGSASSYSDIQILRPHQHMMTSTHCYHLFRDMLRSGVGGLTLSDMASLVGLTPLESRSCSRFLNRHKACTEGMIKLYKQRANTYSLASLLSADDNLEMHVDMQEKLIQANAEIRRIQDLIEKRKIADAAKKIKKKRKKKLLKRSVEHESQQQAVVIAQMDDNSQSQSEENLAQLENQSESEKEVQISKPSISISTAPLDFFLTTAATDLPRLEVVTIEQRVVTPSVIAQPDTPDGNESTLEETAKVPKDVVANVSVQNENITVEEEEKEEDLSNLRELDSGDEEKDLEDDIPNRASKEDQIDLSIRSQLTRQRVNWKPAEDRIILSAFIASSLFIQKYSFDRLFMFNSTQVRDILLKSQRHLPNLGKNNQTNGKTSAAIRRRLHFLMRQKSHYEWYREHVSVALWDHNLYQELVMKHLPPPQHKIYLNPPMEALEQVVEYLQHKFSDIDNAESAAVASPLDTSKLGLTGVDTLLFLRQLKRSEFYWNAILFIIFCAMGNTCETRKQFRSQWKTFLQERGGVVQPEAGNSQMADVRKGKGGKEMKESEAKTEIVSKYASSPQDMYLDYCWKYLRFLTKHLKIMFNNILMLGSLPTGGFQLVYFARGSSMELGSTSNICLSQRDCTSAPEVRLWTARCLILEEILSGGGGGSDQSKMMLVTGKKEQLPMEKCARCLNRARVLVSAKKGTGGALHLNRAYLKHFLGGLPWYSFEEMGDMLRYLEENGDKLDLFALMSVGLVAGIVELTDYWRARITMGKEVFTVTTEWQVSSDDEEEEDEEKERESETAPVKTESQPTPQSTKSSCRKKRKRRPKHCHTSSSSSSSSKKSKRRKVSKKEDKIISQVAECLGNLSVNMGPCPSKPVGLEEGESYISSTADHNTLRLLKLRLHPPSGFVRSGEWHSDPLYVPSVYDDKAVEVNFPSLEVEFLKKKNGLNHSIAGTSHPFSVDCLKDLRRGLVELAYHRFAEDGSSPGVASIEKHLNKYAVLFKMINCARVEGVSGAFLDTIFERKSLVKGLRYLLEAKLIFSVGVTHRKFVTYAHVKDWTIPIRPHQASGGDRRSVAVGHVIMRPWITAIGGISWTTVNRLFMALVGQLQRPSIKLDELCQIFVPTLSPVEALVLIEALAKLKYLTIYKMQEPETTLFSKRDHDDIGIEYHAETLVDLQNLYVAVSPYITTLHAQLNHSIQRRVKKMNQI